MSETALTTIPTIGNLSVEHSNPAAVAAAEAAKARIQAAYIMAIQRPRDTDTSRQRLLKACRRPAFADRAEYAKPVSGKKITGPSIRLAETAMQLWGNLTSEVSIVYEDDTVRRSQVICTDLETNVYFQRQISVSKTVERHDTKGREIVGKRINTDGKPVFIVRATEDEISNKEASLISKAIRNEGLRLIPSDIIDDAITECRRTMADQDAQDPDATRKAIFDNYAQYGVMPADLESYLGNPVDQISREQLADLRRIAAALRDGDARWSDFAGKAEKPEPKRQAEPPKPEPPKPDPKTTIAALLKSLGNPPTELVSGWLYHEKQIKTSLVELSEKARATMVATPAPYIAAMKEWGAENGY